MIGAFKRWTWIVILPAVLLLAGCSAQGEQIANPVSIFPLFPERHQASVIVFGLEIVIGMLLIAAVVNLITQRLRIPYTVGLVVVGFSMTFLRKENALFVSPDLILTLLVPPLVYEAAFLLDYHDLRRELRLVLVLAVPGVILTTFLVGGLVALGAGIGISAALVFGALVAATDPVAVVALFRTMGAPKRLQVLLEGESLFNDGTAIVLYNLMVAIALTGRFNLGGSIVEFVLVSGGGIVVGLAVGVLISQLIGMINNALVETTLTTVTAYGAYILAEYIFGVSGVLAVVAAGLASGQIGPRGMSPTTRIVVHNFWEYIAFLANSFVFLIIGLETNTGLIVQNLAAIAWAIIAVLIARGVTVYGLSMLRKDIPVRWKNILFWGGLRGAISLALALSLSTDLPQREQLQAMALGVVLFTLIVEGLTMRPLIRGSGVIQYSEAHMEYERQHALAIAARAALARLERMNHQGMISDYTLAQLRPVYERRAGELSDRVQSTLESEPALHQEEIARAWIDTLRAERTALNSLYNDNVITEEIYDNLVAEIDFQLTDPERSFPKELPREEIDGSS